MAAMSIKHLLQFFLDSGIVTKEINIPWVSLLKYEK